MPPMTLTGLRSPVSVLEVFEGRRPRIASVQMWHDGVDPADQWEGRTFTTCHMLTLDYLNACDVTFAVFSQGRYDESEHPWRREGRPIAQWSRIDRPEHRNGPG
jgi:hypothetical protein